MPIYGLILVMFTPSQPINWADANSLFTLIDYNKYAILTYFFFFTVLIPGIMYLVLMNRNVIQTPQLDNRSERTTPMILMVIFCLALFYILISSKAVLPKYLYGLSLSGALVIGIFTYVNKYMKVSLHATGVGILTGFVFAYVSEQIYFQLWILVVVILTSGIVLSSRLFLEKHTPKELIVGYFFSLFTTFVLNTYFPMELIKKLI